MTGVETAEGPIEADAVVTATGPWINKLAVPIGEFLPVTPIRVQMVHLRRPPTLESLNTIIIDYTTGAYFREDAGYGTLVGGEDMNDLNEVVNPDAFGLNADHDTITPLLGPRQPALPRIRRGHPERRLRLSIRYDPRRQPDS